MPFRSNIANEWMLSLSIHLGALFVLGIGFWLSAQHSVVATQIAFKVIESPRTAPVAPVAVARVKPKNVASPARSVFGVSRKALVSSGAAAASPVKLGNTLAKEQDTDQLKPSDPDSLPSPVDDFLVSSMPSLVDEVRIPYPPEARKKGIQGAVVMDLLIDSEGRVRDVKLLSGPGFGLDEAAVTAVRSFKFRPATVDGKSVTVRIHYAYRFVLSLD